MTTAELIEQLMSEGKTAEQIARSVEYFIEAAEARRRIREDRNYYLIHQYSGTEDRYLLSPDINGYFTDAMSDWLHRENIDIADGDTFKIVSEDK